MQVGLGLHGPKIARLQLSIKRGLAPQSAQMNGRGDFSHARTGCVAHLEIARALVQLINSVAVRTCQKRGYVPQDPGCRAHILSCANAMARAAESVWSGSGHAVRLLVFVHWRCG